MTELTINQVDVAKLKVEPDEILLVTVKMPLTREIAERVKQAFHQAFEDTGGTIPSILVIDDKIEARVVRSADLKHE